MGDNDDSTDDTTTSMQISNETIYRKIDNQFFFYKFEAIVKVIGQKMDFIAIASNWLCAEWEEKMLEKKEDANQIHGQIDIAWLPYKKQTEFFLRIRVTKDNEVLENYYSLNPFVGKNDLYVYVSMWTFQPSEISGINERHLRICSHRTVYMPSKEFINSCRAFPARVRTHHSFCYQFNTLSHIDEKSCLSARKQQEKKHEAKCKE